MNRIYRSIWNHSTRTFVAAHENSKANGKRASKLAVAVGTSAFLSALMSSPDALAAAQNESAYFNDGDEGACTVVTDQSGMRELSNPTCALKLGNNGDALSVGMGTVQKPKMVSNTNGLFVSGGLEIFGTNVAAGMPTAYIHGGLSLFSGGTTSGTANKLIGLASGNVSSTSTDGVNGSQLFSLAQSASTAIGGGSTVNTNGTISAPTYALEDGKTTLNNAGAAISNIDDRVSNLTDQINGGEIGLVQQDAATRSITVAKDTDGTSVNLIGTAGARKLTGVAVGDVSASSVDAINGSQLFNSAKSTADAFGGGSTVNSNGTISAPSYVLDGGKTTLNNAGDAFTNIDGRTTQNTADISTISNQINNGEIGLVQQDATTRTITVAKDTDGASVNITGTAGARKLTGVTAGDVNASSVDAVNGSQMFAAAQSTADALGGGSTVNVDGTVSKPTYVVDGGSKTLNNAGDAITNIDSRTTQNTADITNINNSLNDITNGGGITYFHANSDLADSKAEGVDSIAIGGAAFASGMNAIAMGSSAQATFNNAMALGTGSIASAENAVALGQGSVADRANAVSVGSAGNERQITNVAAGTAATDAVNVAQLNEVDSKIGQVDQGSVKYDTNPDGTTNYSSVTMGGENATESTAIHNVAAGTEGTDAVNVNQMNEAIANAALDLKDGTDDSMFSANGDVNTEGSVATGTHATAMGATANASGTQSVASGYNAQASGANSMAMGANSKAMADNSVALGADSVADRANTVSVGSSGNERQVANVAAGTATTDAVNVGQLNNSIAAAVGDLPAGTSAKQYTDQQINMVQQGVSDVARNAYSGIAAATALTMIPDVDPGKTIAVGIGTGSYQGYQAAALGASARITPNIKVKLGAGISGQGTTFGAGASYQW